MDHVSAENTVKQRFVPVCMGTKRFDFWEGLMNEVNRVKHRFCARDWALALLCMAMIAVIFVSGVLDTQKVWPDVPLTFAQEKSALRLEAGDSYGTAATTSTYDLPQGRYRIKWRLSGDGVNRIRLRSTNDAVITPSVIETTPGAWEEEAYFDIGDAAHSFSVEFEFADGTWMELNNLRLYSPEYTDHAFTAAALLAAACLLLILRRRGKLTREGLGEAAVLAIAVLLVSYPCLQADTPMAWDTQFHAARIMNLADALRAGQIPARVGGFSYNGYGAVTSVFYPDLLLYPWALMSLGGASMSYIINSLVVAVNALTAICMYAAGRRLLRSREAAVCASLLYLFSLYRLGDLYTRLMVGEMLAMAFLPLFLMTLAEVVIGDKRRWPMLALSATLIFRSHLLATVLCALAAVVFCAAYLKRIVREKRLGAIGLAILAALLMNINQIVPLLQTYMSGVTTSVVQFGFADSALTAAELFKPDGYLGLALVLGAAAYLAAPGEADERRTLLRVLFAAGAVCMLLSTDLIPWKHIVLLTGGLVEVFQFPMRFLLLTSLCFALCGGMGLARLFDGRRMQAAMIALAICTAASLPAIEGMPPYAHMLEFGQGAKPYMVYPEYQFEGTDMEAIRSKAVLLDGAEMTAYEKEGTRIAAAVSSPQGGTAAFPLFGFEGYAAELDGERLEWTRGANNRLTVQLPAGAEGELRVWYEGMTLWRVCDAVSLAAVICLCAYVIKKHKNESDR